MSDDLVEIERVAGGLLRQLTSGQRRSLLRRMARDMAARNRARINAQTAPDGTAFEPRRKREPARTVNQTACFLYPSGGSGGPRKVVLRNYAIEKTGETNYMMTGFDIEAGAIRSFFHDKVIKWLPVDADHRNASAGRLRRRGNLRRKAMFRRLATARLLRSGEDDQGFWVGFTGRAAEVARIHHEGLRDRPSLKARPISYPRRPLVGFSNEDRQALLDMLYNNIKLGEF
ncbi:MAG TPA: phage virion morphogenesis protein [Pedomonas sp.]|uniref:phage virion morphogenesis protein n=1 Tax=Pedomonas sp. TaxID=2976421 RepID=UPI002F407385